MCGTNRKQQACARDAPGSTELLSNDVPLTADSFLCTLQQGERSYYRLRLERTNKKHLGKRTKRAAEAEAAEKDKAK
jgi:hypothetical protein